MVEENIPKEEIAIIYNLTTVRENIKHLCGKKEGYHNDLTVLNA